MKFYARFIGHFSYSYHWKKSDQYLPICSQTTVVVTSHLKSLLYTETSIYVNIIQGVVTTMR